MTWGQGRSQSLRTRARRAIPYRCICGATRELELDHIVNLAIGGTDAMANLQWLCHACHIDKTQRERQAGMDAAKAKRGSVSRRYRDLEPHPGRMT